MGSVYGRVPGFLRVVDPGFRDSGVPLFILGASGTTSIIGGFDCFLQGFETACLASGNLNLFLNASPSGSLSRSMNLFIGGQTHSISSSLEMVLWNGQSGLNTGNNYLPLFIQGDGVTAGAIPASGTLNLFLKRDPTEMMPLFLQGPGVPVASGFDLYMQGSYVLGSGFDMFMPAHGLASGTIPLFLHGF